MRGAGIFIAFNDDVILVLPLKTNVQYNFDLAGLHTTPSFLPGRNGQLAGVRLHESGILDIFTKLVCLGILQLNKNRHNWGGFGCMKLLRYYEYRDLCISTF